MMELIGVSKSYGDNSAIENVTLTIGSDEYLTLLGPSGSGKSTLLRLIAGLENPDAGTILLNGEDITTQATHLRGLGFVQQKYALFPHMSVGDNVAFGLRHRLVDPITSEEEVKRRVDTVLDLVGLSDLGDRGVGQISGGQKQRVSLARTLVAEPKICLLDEPLGALDANLRERMTVELRRIREALGVTFLHVTGNEVEALAMGDRMVVLDEGRALQIDDPDTVFGAPVNIRVARFLNAYNVLPGETVGDVFRSGDADLPMPFTAGAGYYGLRFDVIDIDTANTPQAKGRGSLEATFVTSEFMGSRMIYFFRRADGSVIEVERHLSRSDPINPNEGETLTLSWDVGDVLLFDRAGDAIGQIATGVAA